MPPSGGSVLIVGAGIVGRAAAWQLAERGRTVTLIDPALELEGDRNNTPPPAGSQAALGVLMARVFQRSSGRAWRLRQQSHALWGQWLAELEQRGHRLPYRQGLLLLAASDDDLARQAAILADRQRRGIPMQRLEPPALADLQPVLPGRPLGACSRRRMGSSIRARCCRPCGTRPSGPAPPAEPKGPRSWSGEPLAARPGGRRAP